jgi:hypothetical protein
MRVLLVAVSFVLVVMGAQPIHAKETHQNHPLAKDIISRFNNTFRDISIINPLLPRLYKSEFIEYYTQSVIPRLSHIADFISKDAHVFVDIDADGDDELILWSEGLSPSAWGGHEFIAILSNVSGSWRIKVLERLENVSINCKEVNDCQFAWSHYSPPVGPNIRHGGMLSYAQYGASGHTFWLVDLGYNRFTNKFYIKESSSAYPLIIDPTWK